MKYSYHHLDTILQTLRRRFEIIVIEEEQDYRKSTSTPINNSIRLGVLGQSYLVALAAAHEFGHCLSFRESSFPDEDIIRRYRKRLHLTKEEKGLIMEEEKRAWRYGFRFLYLLGITIDEKMRQERRRSLAGYARSLETR